MTQSNSLKWKSLKLTRYETCCICSKKFIIKIRPDGKILTNCFHGVLDLNHFLGWTHTFDSKKDIEDWDINFKNNYYRIIGFSEWSREVVYWVWKLFHRKKWHFWECVECANRPDDI